LTTEIVYEWWTEEMEKMIEWWLTLEPTNAVCGTASKSYSVWSTTYGTDTFCAIWTTSTPSFPTAWNPVSWECWWVNGGVNASCQASIAWAVVNGQCGSSSGWTFASVPVNNLCSWWTTGSVSTTATWYSWSCEWINGWSNVSCNAGSIWWWIKTMWGTGVDFIKWVATDLSGNVYVVWHYYNNANNTTWVKDFSRNYLLGTGINLNHDVFVAKLNSSWQQQWIKTMWWISSDQWFSIAVDNWGNVYVVWVYYNNSSDINLVKDFAGNQLLWVTSTASNDIFVAKLNSSWQQQWIKTMWW